VATENPSRNRLKTIRTLLWVLVALAIAGTVAMVLIPRATPPAGTATSISTKEFGGPFTLVGRDGKPFSSARLAGKPYAIYFGYTRCGDVCPITLQRLVKLRDEAGGTGALNIVFVTIDPANDGPKEVGQYAALFNAPIIGLTGSPAQIEQVKKQYGIYAAPEPMKGGGMKVNHTATALLFDRDGKFVATIATEEPDSSALAKMKRIAA
jgi:protein SCO1/2